MFINTTNDGNFKDKTPEMFDKYFAYAYVLNEENKWAGKFEDILKQMGYTPVWCSTKIYHDRFDCKSFSAGFSKLFSAATTGYGSGRLYYDRYSGGRSSGGGHSMGGGSSRGGGFSGGGRGGRWPEVAGKKIF